MRAIYLRNVNAFIRYLDLPGGDPVRVYLHGLDSCSAALVPVAVHPALAGRRALLIDLLGFGLSDRPDAFDYTLEAHADAVSRLLEDLDVRGCEVIGHSLGGSVGIVLASRYPELVSALVAAEANLDPGMGPVSALILAGSEKDYERQGFQAGLDELTEQARADPRSIAAATLGMRAAASPGAIYRTARSLTAPRHPTLREQLVELQMPRTFLVGEHTLSAAHKPASGEAGDRLQGTGVKRVTVHGSGHWMMFDNPDDFGRTIAQALDRRE
jgi:pimeloyl-ACP methyl ester carboxylesterase